MLQAQGGMGLVNLSKRWLFMDDYDMY